MENTKRVTPVSLSSTIVQLYVNGRRSLLSTVVKFNLRVDRGLTC